MSEEQKKQDEAKTPGDASKPDGAKLPGPLPGLGAGPSKAPIPGLSGQPSKAPLPGLGAGPSKAPLPGLSSASPAGLAGLGKKKPAAAVPAFLQQAEPEPETAPEPAGPSKEEIERDPFGHAPVASTTAVRPSFAPDAGFIGETGDASVSYSESDAGRSKKPLFIGGTVLFIIALLFGFMLGNGKSTRVELNIAIRDALIVQYEVKKAGLLFNDVQASVNAALSKAKKREYDETHVAYLSSKVSGNPIRPMIFTERNYKRFDSLAVQWLMDYNKKWFELDKLIQAHRMQTLNDETALKKSKTELEKLIKNQYGVVFLRNKQADGQLEGNVVILAPGEKEGILKVQAANGTYGDDREVYNPEGADSKLTEEPDKYVIPLGAASKIGLLGNASQSHFKDYGTRLKEMSDLMRGMNELQGNLLGKIGELASQDPVMFGGIDPEEALANYKTKDSQAQEAPAAE